jgi:hypothetical protein
MPHPVRSTAWRASESTTRGTADAQQPEVNPQGTVALRAGLPIDVGIVDGGSVVVVALSPTSIPDVLVSTVGAVGPTVSSPSAASGRGDLAAAKPSLAHLRPPSSPARALTRTVRASKTSVREGDTAMRMTTSGHRTSKSKRKNEQQPTSRSAKLRALVTASAANTNSNRVASRRTLRSIDSRNKRSNSATRSGCSTVGSEHDSGTQPVTPSIAIHRR